MTDLKLRLAVLERDKFACQDCGHVGESGSKQGEIQVHHIEPERLGGLDDMENLIALCVACHRARDIELRQTHPGRTNFTGKTNLTLQVPPEFAKELNAAVATVTPRASRSSVMQTAIREWMERNRKPATRKRQETQS